MLNFIGSPKEAELREIFFDLVARFVALKPLVFSTALVDMRVQREYVDFFKIVPESHRKIVRIVSGCKFDRPCSEFGVNIFVGDNGNFAIC